MKYASIAVMAATLATVSLNAQDNAPQGTEPDQATAGPVITLSGDITGDAVMKGDDKKYGDLSSTGFNLDISYPIQIGGAVLTLGAAYDETILDTTGDMPVPENLHSLALSASYVKPLTDTWTLVAMASPYCNTAGDSMQSDGFGVSAALAASYKVNADLTASIGIAYDSLYNGDGIVLPVASVNWILAPAWSLDIGYPETALNYAFNDKLTFSLVADGKFGSYYVDSEALDNKALRSKLGDSVVNYEDLRAGLRAKYAFCKNMELAASAGWVFKRTFDYNEVDYKIESDEGTPYCNLAVKLMF